MATLLQEILWTCELRWAGEREKKQIGLTIVFVTSGTPFQGH